MARGERPAEPLPSGDTREGFARHLEWERRLFDARWAVVSWPEAYGGRDASLWEWLIFEEEYYRAGAPQRVTQNGIFLLAPTLFEFGTPEQQDRFLPTMASGEETWCQGWSEPDAGSDLAGDHVSGACATRRRAAGASSGQKTWTTRGAFCTHLFGLFRTDPEAAAPPRAHLLPRPARHPRRDRARLRPARRRRRLRRGLLRRRVRARRPRARRGRRGLARRDGDDRLRARSHAAQPGPLPRDASAGSSSSPRRARPRDGAATPRCATTSSRRTSTPRRTSSRRSRTVTRISDGESTGAESSLTKVFWSELDVRLHETALRLLGPRPSSRTTAG